MVASQMASAELERTTVDIEAGGDGHKVGAARHRPGRPLRRLPHPLPGGPRRRCGGRGRRPPAGDGRRRRADRARHRRRAALHRAAAALLRSDPDQEDGGARHRPALDLRVDALGAARSRLCAAGEEAARARGQGPAGHRLPRELLRPLRRIRLHRRPRGEARQDLGRRPVVEGRAPRFLAPVLRRRRRDQGPARRRGARRAERAARPAHLPGRAPTAAIRASARPAAPAGCR